MEIEASKGNDEGVVTAGKRLVASFGGIEAGGVAVWVAMGLGNLAIARR
jgi:hypothetical protein